MGDSLSRALAFYYRCQRSFPRSWLLTSIEIGSANENSQEETSWLIRSKLFTRLYLHFRCSSILLDDYDNDRWSQSVVSCECISHAEAETESIGRARLLSFFFLSTSTLPLPLCRVVSTVDYPMFYLSLELVSHLRTKETQKKKSRDSTNRDLRLRISSIAIINPR